MRTVELKLLKLSDPANSEQSQSSVAVHLNITLAL